MQQIHDGLIGEVITMLGLPHAWPRRPQPPPARGTKELAYQIANYSCFTWLNGTFLEDWLIHNIDVCCWAKNAWPVSVQGMGGRQVRTRARPALRPLRRRIHLRRTARASSPMAGTWPIALTSGAPSSTAPKAAGSWAKASPNRACSRVASRPPRILSGATRGRPATITSASTTCCSTPSATTSPTTRPSAPPNPASPPSWAAWPANPANRSPGTRPSPPTMRAGARAGRLHVGFQPAGHARRQGPLPHRHARPDARRVSRFLPFAICHRFKADPELGSQTGLRAQERADSLIASLTDQSNCWILNRPSIQTSDGVRATLFVGQITASNQMKGQLLDCLPEIGPNGLTVNLDLGLKSGPQTEAGPGCRYSGHWPAPRRLIALAARVFSSGRRGDFRAMSRYLRA